MQLTWKVGLTGEEYVSQKAWTSASLKRCPHHPKGGCGFHYLGTYERRVPAGALVPRWYCPAAQQTFSLLPDCLAARYPGLLRDVERAVDLVEEIGAVEVAARVLRGHEALLPGVVRWTRRRLNAVRATLTTLIGLMPEVFMIVIRCIRCRGRLEVVVAALPPAVLRRYLEAHSPAGELVIDSHLARGPPHRGPQPCGQLQLFAQQPRARQQAAVA